MWLHSGRVALYLPGMQRLTAAVRRELDDCACLLIDGTCWHDDELIRLGLADKTARDGTPADRRSARQPGPADRATRRTQALHPLNNTNPILLDDAPERRMVSERGMEVAVDGLEVKV
jgi:pyrroloquinoline quinone biosynthesis protein B